MQKPSGEDVRSQRRTCSKLVLQRLHANGLRPLGARVDFELNALVLVQGAVTLDLDLQWWTKTSSLAPSGVMKPKPFSALNHFTVPCVIRFSTFLVFIERQ